MKPLGQFVHPLLPPYLTKNFLFVWCPNLRVPGSATDANGDETREKLLRRAEPRAFRAGSAGVRASCASCARSVPLGASGPLATRAPGGGVVRCRLSSGCANFQTARS